MRVILIITNVGIRGYVTTLSNEYVANPVKYMEIKEPISDYRVLRRVNYKTLSINELIILGSAELDQLSILFCSTFEYYNLE